LLEHILYPAANVKHFLSGRDSGGKTGADRRSKPRALQRARDHKEEIIRTISPRFADAVRTALVLPGQGEITAADVGRYHLAGIEVLWGFRFLTRDPRDLVERDPAMAESTTGLNDWLTHWFATLFERLITQGHMRRPDPADDLVRVAANAVILWSSWLNFLMTSRSKPDVEPSDVAEGALQSFLTFAPYLNGAFAAEVRAVLHEKAERRRKPEPR
jgi:hypothetical protein